MERRRDMNNILLSGLLSLHTVNDAAGHESKHVPCLGRHGPLDDAELVQRMAEMREAQTQLAAQIREIEASQRRHKRHLYVVPDPPDAA